MNTPFLRLLCALLTVLWAAPLATFAQTGQPGPLVPGLPNVSNPYTPFGPNSGGAGPLNPYTNMAPGSYAPYYPGGYYQSPYSGVADIIDAQNRYWSSQEMSRILREKAFQEHLKGRKAAIELERWIRATTPTFTETQAKWAAQRLKRIRDRATPSEIISGNALNLLLKDLGKPSAGAASTSDVPLTEDVLQRLNVTVKNSGNLGLLRNDGRYTWPTALEDITDEGLRRKIDVLAQDLVHQAQSNGKVNANGLRDLEAKIIKLRKELNASILKIPARQFLRADRFMQAFQNAIYALENDTVAQKYFDYRRWIKGGKTVQQLVDYMQSNGLEFGPSVPGDEAAYSAAYSAFAQRDIVLDVTRRGKENE